MRACYEGTCSAWTQKTAIAAGSGTQPSEAAADATVDLPLTKTTVCTDTDACAGETATALKVGNVSGSGRNWRTYLKTDLSKIPTGAQVTGATLRLQSSATTPDLAVHGLNGAWATTGTGSDLDTVTAPGPQASI